MISIKIGAVLACVLGVVWGQVDRFMSSPDVDVQAGFFPDSGHWNTGPIPGPTYSRSDNFHLDNGIHARPSINRNEMLSKRLRALLARVSRRKVLTVRKPQPSVPSHIENPGFLHLFIGSKDKRH